MATPEHDPEHDEAHEPRAGGATEDSAGSPGEPGGRRGRRPAAGRRLRVAMILAGVALVVVTIAVAKVVNPSLAVLPPVIRDQAGLPLVSSSGSVAPTLESASATPSSTPSPPAQSPARPNLLLSYEAESAEVVGGRVRRVPSASGGKVAGNLDRFDDHVTFTVSVPAAGRYTVTFYYICGGAESRPAVISVNSGTPTASSFPSTGSWETVRSRAVPIDLATGSNRIRFASNGSLTPDLDRITVGP